MTRHCSNCGSSTTYIKRSGIPHWYRDGKGGHLCHKCRLKLIDHPIHHPRRIKFRDNTVTCTIIPRRGICSNPECGKSIGDEYINWKGELAIIKQTDMHHLDYHEEDVLKDTQELCASCHGKESWRIRKEMTINNS